MLYNESKHNIPCKANKAHKSHNKNDFFIRFSFAHDEHTHKRFNNLVKMQQHK